jgi:chromosome segregation ATPase
LPGHAEPIASVRAFAQGWTVTDIADRILQLENLVFELPGLMNSRLDGLEGHIRAFRMSFEDTGGRLNRIEKIIGLLQADVRDLRGGVTAQLKAQDERLAGVTAQLKAQDERLAGVTAQLKAQDERLAGFEARIAACEQSIAELTRQQVRVEQKLATVADGLDRVDQSVGRAELRLGSMEGLLKAIAAKLDIRS